MKNIFNLFKKKKDYQEEESYWELYQLDKDRYVEISKKPKWSKFKYEVYTYANELSNNQNKKLITGYTNDAGTAYSEANNFVQRIENIEIVILTMSLGYDCKQYTINHDDAVRLLEEFKDNNVDSLEFYDYQIDKYFAFDKDIVNELSLDGYYE